MTGPPDREGTLHARVTRRLLVLGALGILRRPATLARLHPQLSGTRYLRELMRLVQVANWVQTAFERMVPAALQEPGRQVREHRIVSLRPQGSVHWPLTVRRNLQRGPGAIEFVCDVRHKEQDTPENVLLAATMLELSNWARGLEVGRTVRLSRDDGQMLRGLEARSTREARRSFLAALGPLANRVLAAGPSSIATLETRTMDRLRPPQPLAPTWARALLECRANMKNLVARPSGPIPDSSSLFSLLVWLETLTALRELRALPRTGQSLPIREAEDYQGGPAPNCWIIGRTEGSAPICVAAVDEATASGVRNAALHAIWYTRDAGQQIDHWTVVHPLPAAIELPRRGKTEVTFFSLPIQADPDLDWYRALGRSLGPPQH